MSETSLDAKQIAAMFVAGARRLESQKEIINELNVFPVPDGDTGTNMTLTIVSAADDVSGLYSTGDISMETLCKAISSGSLRGARGNSGVILSQLFRGFTKVAKKIDGKLDAQILAEACDKAVETAYKAVMKPKEGTILTVSRAVSEKVSDLVDSGVTDMKTIIEGAIAAGDEMLLKTPEMLPVLKQAGVVDSGGQGLMEVLHGAYDAFCGKEVDFSPITSGGSGKKADTATAEPPKLKFLYCTEYIIRLKENFNFNVKLELDYKTYLESIGDSIVVVTDENLVKVHVHTNDPGMALQRALKYGQLDKVKIENLLLEEEGKIARAHEHIEEKMSGKITEEPEPKADEPRKDIGFIAVSVGEGINEIFSSLGVDMIIAGGQTMNPSTEDMLNAIDKINADHIFILPNNKNIVLAAQQAANMTEDKDIIVIPTKSVPQGIAAMVSYMPDTSAEENANIMTEQIELVKTGQVTYAVRDTIIDDKEIRENDYMGIGDSGILAVGTDKTQVTIEMVDAMVDDSSELISVYYGEDVDEDAANKLAEELSAKYSGQDVELQFGGQPVYSYIISVE
ncbi:MAG: DAK2 domain-containing protein [Lachnospiraceae bacterium]|nr:DAK2 domain-containing protein [Lachnospiraceae bacterium]